jgi:hypothetical protein
MQRNSFAPLQFGTKVDRLNRYNPYGRTKPNENSPPRNAILSEAKDLMRNSAWTTSFARDSSLTSARSVEPRSE